MERLLEVIKEKFKEYMELMVGIGNDDTEHDFRRDFIVEHLFGLTTYDTHLTTIFNNTITEVMRVIYERGNFEYIKDEKNYIKFILVANILDEHNMINWGSSIRGCWFDFGEAIEFSALGDEKFMVEDSKDFIKLIEWFECKDLGGDK